MRYKIKLLHDDDEPTLSSLSAEERDKAIEECEKVRSAHGQLISGVELLEIDDDGKETKVCF